jgi:hypothetical protein
MAVVPRIFCLFVRDGRSSLLGVTQIIAVRHFSRHFSGGHILATVASVRRSCRYSSAELDNEADQAGGDRAADKHRVEGRSRFTVLCREENAQEQDREHNQDEGVYADRHVVILAGDSGNAIQR